MDILEMAKKYFDVRELDVPADFKSMKNSKMNTSIEQYYIDGLGNMTFQHAKGMMGLMKMEMMCITPIERDLPLFSFDVIDVMGNYTLIIELYDVMLEKDNALNDKLLAIKSEFLDLPDDDRGAHWYDGIKMSSSVSKKGKKKAIMAGCNEIYQRYIAEYFSYAAGLETVDADAKCQASNEYVEGLLMNGGPSTDIFVDMLGKEKTTEYFKKYIFGTER